MHSSHAGGLTSRHDAVKVAIASRAGAGRLSAVHAFG